MNKQDRINYYGELSPVQKLVFNKIERVFTNEANIDTKNFVEVLRLLSNKYKRLCKTTQN